MFSALDGLRLGRLGSVATWETKNPTTGNTDCSGIFLLCAMRKKRHKVWALGGEEALELEDELYNREDWLEDLEGAGQARKAGYTRQKLRRHR